VCLALDHADSHGVLHRSLEPAKIMMQWDGTVKVLGYGVSTMVSAMPRTGVHVPPLFYYMSPEQVKGDTMDIRSNIFSWGAMLYEMVTDRKPFAGDDVQSVRQKIWRKRRNLRPRLSPDEPGVSRSLCRPLAKSPEERYQQGQDVLLDLEKPKRRLSKAAKEASKAQSGLVIPDKLRTRAPGASSWFRARRKWRTAFIPAVSPSTPRTPAKSGTGREQTVRRAESECGRRGSEHDTQEGSSCGRGNGRNKSASTTPSREGKRRNGARAGADVGGRSPCAGGRTPKFRGDPMMAEPGPQAGKAVSFSTWRTASAQRDLSCAQGSARR